jgi:hypothetical protein
MAAVTWIAAPTCRSRRVSRGRLRVPSVGAGASAHAIGRRIPLSAVDATGGVAPVLRHGCRVCATALPVSASPPGSWDGEGSVAGTLGRRPS